MTPPTPKVNLRVWPEWGSSGIWRLKRPLQPQAGRMVDCESLDLPADLRRDFEAWWLSPVRFAHLFWPLEAGAAGSEEALATSDERFNNAQLGGSYELRMRVEAG